MMVSKKTERLMISGYYDVFRWVVWHMSRKGWVKGWPIQKWETLGLGLLPYCGICVGFVGLNPPTLLLANGRGSKPQRTLQVSHVNMECGIRVSL